MNDIFSFNFKPTDIWANIDRSNQFKINGLTADEWVAANPGKTYNDFWHVERTNQLKANFEKIWSNSSNPSDFPLDGVFRMLGSTNDKSAMQVLDSMSQWEKFANIQESGGRAVGFDLETFGSITKVGTDPAKFGITEFAIGSRVYDGAGNIERTGRSYIFGINKEQADYLSSLSNKFASKGWNSLEETEQEALKRISMYGTNNAIKSEMINGKAIYVAGSLGAETRTVSAINAGINKLKNVYDDYAIRGIQQKDIFTGLVNQLLEANAADNTVLFGANSNYDIDAIINAAKSLGVDATGVDSLRNNMLDIVYSARALAASNNKSVNEYFYSMYGVRAGASVDEQLKVERINAVQMHQGYDDVVNEGRLLDIRVKEILDTKEKIQQTQEHYKQYNGLEDSVFLVNRGRLNQELAQEMGVVNGTPVPNYSFTNEYWTVDTKRSGYIELNGEQKYALTLNSYIDDNDTSIVLVKNSKEEALEQLTSSSSVFNKKQVTQADALGQQSFKYKDFGRREFDKVITPSSVGIDKGNNIYGFETLENYLKITDTLPDGIITDTNSKSVNALMDYVDKNYANKQTSLSLLQIKEHFSKDKDVDMLLSKVKAYYDLKDDNTAEDLLEVIDTYTDKQAVQKVRQYVSSSSTAKPFKSYYQAQAFVGMYDKLKEEKVLLQEIVDQINKTHGNATNIDKTIIARKAYTESIQYLDSVYERKQAGKFYNVMSDALGIDIMTPDSNIKRINGYSKDTITSDVNRIFKNLDKDDIFDILKDLDSRGLFPDDEAYKNIVHRVASMTSDDLYGISQDIGYELSKVTEEYINRDKSIVHSFRNDTNSKNLQLLGQKLETDRIIKYKKHTFAKAYENSFDSINKIISNAVNSNQNTIYVNTTGNDSAFKNYINKIAARLNIEQTSLQNSDKTGADLLYELFTKTKNYKGEKTSYAINNYINEGLNSFLTVGDNGNAYLFLTRQEDAAKFYVNLLDGKFNLSDRKELTNPTNKTLFESINNYATFIEIPKINEYQLSEGAIRTVNQGNIEKFIIPQLNVSTNSAGKLRAYYNSGEFGFLSTLRMSMGNAIEHTLLGEYEAASSAVRRSQNRYLDDLSSSASYRGRVLFDDAGNVIGVRRIAEFTPSDFIQAHKARVENELYTLFKGAALEQSNDLNTAQKIVKAFGKRSGIGDSSMNELEYIYNITKGTEFQEFFKKRLFVGPVSEDVYLSGMLKGDEFNKNFFQIIRDMANDENITVFDKSVAEALEKIPVNKIVNQVLSESASEKGEVSFGVRPGDYNDAASLYSTMRPTYGQQNNGMYYTLSEMDNTKFIGFKNGVPIRFNTAVIAAKEYDDRMALVAGGYQPIPGQDFASRRRSMVARVKQMGDYELQLKYIEMQENADIIANELGISKTRYNKSLEYFQQNYMSLYNDKIFLAPGLNEQKLFQDREGKKILYDLNGLDVNKSYKEMKKLVDNKTVVTTDTVIGIRENGTPVFYTGPDAVFTKENLKDFFSDDNLDTSVKKSYVIPVQGDIFDNKVMINGAEKGTTHSINITSFMEYTGIKNRDEALKVANSLFDKTFDGAAVVANLGVEKHGNIISVHSIWNTITSQYIEKGQGQALANHLNRLVNENEAFKGFEEFRFINGELISSSSNAKNFSTAVETLYNQIRTDSVLRSDINESIVDELTDLNDTHSFNALVQRQSMNEQMGTRMVIDQRVEQSIRTRGMQMGGSGMQAIDNDLADMLKVYSQNYNAKGTSLTGELKEFVDIFGAAKNAHRIHLLNGKNDMQRSARGIVESMLYYYNPTKYNPKDKNIVKININELIDEGVKLKGGLSTKELHNSIFFVDGKPSDFLKKQAKKSGVNLYEDSYSILIDLNQIKFNVTDIIDKKQVTRSFNGVMIPIQSVFSNVNDKTFFQTQQSAVTSFINKLTDITNNPHKYNKEGAEKALSFAYSNFIKTISKQIGYLDKDSDVYKAFQQYIMPTSQELLSQDEAAPLIEDMMDKETQRYIKTIKENESLLMINPDNKQAIKELDDAYDWLYGNKEKNIVGKLERLGERIRTDDNYYSKLMSLSSNKFLNEASKVTVNGKTYYGIAVAMSKEAFERGGINVGAVGLEAFQNWETKNYQLERIEEFSKKHNFGARKTTIAKRINELNIDGLRIDKSKSITEQIGNYLRNQYGINGSSMLSIKDINKAIVEGKAPTQVLKVFEEEIGIKYLSEIGTFSELTRYPSFRSQPTVRTLLDATLQGKQVRVSNAILSSINQLDQDGDKMFLAMFTDGISIVNRDTVIDGKKVFEVHQEIFNRFAINESRGLLAELVEDGDVFKVNNPNVITRQYAAMLEKMKPQAYEDAVMSWAKDNSIRVSSIDKLSKAQLYAASVSRQMHDTFIGMDFNTLTDEDSIIASIASRFRKKNIGSISTPNYHMRNALLEAMQNPAMSSQQKQLLNDTYVSLSNMLSKAGGFFSDAEQKSIDVKHAKDGLDIARTTRYSEGMSLLFGTNKHTPQKNIAGIRNILEATNAGLFKASSSELDIMATTVANTSLEKFNEAIKSYSGKTQEYLTTLRRLLDVQKEIPNFDKIYANKLIKGSLDNDIFNAISEIEKLIASDKDGLAKKYLGTGFFNVYDIFANPFSADKPQFIENNVYFKPGDINDDWVDKAYLFSNNKFTEIDMITGQNIYRSFKSKVDSSSLIEGIPGGVNFRDFVEQPKLRNQVNDSIAMTKFERTLNSVLLDKNDVLLSKMPQKFIDIGNAKNGIHKYGVVWSGVNNLFIGKKTQGRGTSDIYNNIAELTKTYDYAVRKRFINKSIHPGSSGELIRQLNKQIAENPKNYTGEYDTAFREHMSSIFGGDEVLDKYIEEAKHLSSFDGQKSKKYTQSLDFLKQNTYDIMEQQEIIEGSFKSVEIELEGLKKQGVSDDELKGLQNILDTSKQTTEDLLKTLNKSNKMVVGSVQQDIYGLFESVNQMDYFFGWNKVSDNTIVGFGEYMGKTFNELSESDIKNIINAGTAAQSSINTMSTYEKYALTHTIDALNNYKPQSHTPYSVKVSMGTSEEVSNLIKNNREAVTTLHKNLAERTTEQTKEAAERAAQSATKKTITGSFFDSAKKFAQEHVTPRNIGIAAAGLAAIGIANNLLHNQKNQSPLTPAKKPNGNGSPDVNGNYPDSAPMQQAPMSQSKTVYHDRSSGFNFKVSAKTNSYIQDSNNAKLIGMAGGGQTSVYSQADTSGVTDNWLANKFAELA